MFVLAGEPRPLCYLLSIVIITYLLNTNTTTILAQQDPSLCGAFGYATGSTYEKNLETTLSTLPTTNSGHGFYNFSTGLDEDRVNSIALCRGDINLDVCQQCLKDSIVKLQQRCPNRMEALGYYGYCMLRYSNEIILGNIEAFSFYSYSSTGSQSKDAGEINKALTQLYNNLIVKAASGDTLLKFATGSHTIGSDDTRNIYALMQCTPYLSKEECSNCFNSITQHSDDWLNGIENGKFYRHVCNIRYDTQPFYNETNEVKQQQQQQQPSPSPTILRQPPSQTILQPSLQPPSPQPPEKKKNNNKRSRILLSIITVVVTVIVIVVTIIAIFMKLRNKKNQRKPPPEIQPEFNHYPFDTVKAATNNFSEENKLGSGGFGEVYKGTLEDGKLIAVKRLKSSIDQRDTEFVNEVTIVAKLQHRNLVKLLGYSIQESERLLILEFLPNGSLDDYLFNATKCKDLDWKARYNIIKGIAKGLEYLHVDSSSKIIHHDIKAANVLLDENLEPKIADFGIAKLFKATETHKDTKHPNGTMVYMAPEYIQSGRATVKIDVYSFGILVLEIIIGQKLQNFQQGYLPRCAWRSLKNDKIPDIVDRNMKIIELTSMNEIKRSVQIGLLCVQKKADDRPTMDSVFQMLNNLSMPLDIPADPKTSMEHDVDLKMLPSSGKEDSNSIMEN